MNTSLFYETLSAQYPALQIEKDAPLARHTSFGVGGCADLLYRPADSQELQNILQSARKAAIPVTILGKMTNVIVRDGGIRGLVVAMERMDACEFCGNTITAQAGARLMAVARKTTYEHQLKGMAFAGGIPGSIGGAVIMNAGAYGGEIKDIIRSVTYLEPDTLALRTVKTSPEDFGYRHSRFMDMGAIVVAAEFSLEQAEDDSEKQRFEELMTKRRQKQPVHLPSAGSVFKRPEGYFAGALIEQAGLKGLTVGGAQVSELHAGFIVNIGGATAKDITTLIGLVQQKVLEHAGVLLEREVRIIGEEIWN